MKKVRWGVLSTAHIAQSQVIPAIFRAENAEMMAIASRGSGVHQIAARLGIPKAYESYEALLQDPDIDAVYIPLPNHLHQEWTFKAAQAGKHVLCEKPASLTANDTKAMVDFCRSKNVMFMEAFMYQFHLQHERVKELIASGEIGEVKLFKSSHTFYMENRKQNIRMDQDMGGGSIYDVGCYCIHAARFILGSEPDVALVQAQMMSGIDLSSFVYMKLANGIPVMFDSSFDMTNRNEYEVIGTKGSIKVPFAFRPDKNGHLGVIEIDKDGEKRTEKVFGDVYKMEIEHFSKMAKDGGDPLYSGESAIQNMRAIEACYESIKTGGLVKVKQEEESI